MRNHDLAFMRRARHLADDAEELARAMSPANRDRVRGKATRPLPPIWADCEPPQVVAVAPMPTKDRNRQIKTTSIPVVSKRRGRRDETYTVQRRGGDMLPRKWVIKQ